LKCGQTAVQNLTPISKAAGDKSVTIHTKSDIQ